MKAILDIIVPVFGTVLVGWLIGRTKLLSPEGLRGLTNVTFYALFPALLFRSMSSVRLQALSFDILFVFFGASLLLYVASMALARAMGMRLGEGTVFALSAVFSNGVGIGIPFISYAFGEAGLVPLLMIISMNSLILLTLSSFLIEVGQQGGSGAGLLGKLGGAVVTMLKHPVIPSIFAELGRREGRADSPLRFKRQAAAVIGIAANISTAWTTSTSVSVQRRPILSDNTPAITRPPALPMASTATAMNACSPMLFFAMPLTLPITINPAPAPIA